MLLLAGRPAQRAVGAIDNLVTAIWRRLRIRTYGPDPGLADAQPACRSPSLMASGRQFEKFEPAPKNARAPPAAAAQLRCRPTSLVAVPPLVTVTGPEDCDGYS